MMLRLPAGQRILGAALCSRRSGLGSLSPGGMVLWKILRKILGGGTRTYRPLSLCPAAGLGWRNRRVVGCTWCLGAVGGCRERDALLGV